MKFDYEYHLARCTGSTSERLEAAEFHAQGRLSDRDLVIEAMKIDRIDPQLIARVEAGEDVSNLKVKR